MVDELARGVEQVGLGRDLRAEAGNSALTGEVATYLANLRKQAKIIYN